MRKILCKKYINVECNRRVGKSARKSCDTEAIVIVHNKIKIYRTL